MHASSWQRFTDDSALPKNAHIILTSTVSPADARSLAGDIRRSRPDVGFLDAPVSGGTPRAASGDLTILASGFDAVGCPAEALSVLQALSGTCGNSNNLYIVPGEAGNGAAIKLVNQHLAGEFRAVSITEPQAPTLSP